MMANGAFLAALVVVVATAVILEQLAFLRPYRSVLVRHYLPWLLGAMAVAFLNLCALSYLVIQRLRLGDTGRKLAHLERQLQSGDTIVRDLSARLAAEE
jgi:hypothetical protein